RRRIGVIVSGGYVHCVVLRIESRSRPHAGSRRAPRRRAMPALRAYPVCFRNRVSLPEHFSGGGVQRGFTPAERAARVTCRNRQRFLTGGGAYIESSKMEHWCRRHGGCRVLVGVHLP